MSDWDELTGRCGDRGPRVGDSGVMICVLPEGHQGQHQPDPSWNQHGWPQMGDRRTGKADEVEGLARILRNEVELLATKWEGGSAHTSAGKIADLAKALAEAKAPTKVAPR